MVASEKNICSTFSYDILSEAFSDYHKTWVYFVVLEF